MTVVHLPIPEPSAGLYRNHWRLSQGPVNHNPYICGKRCEFVCTREKGHDGPHAAHNYSVDSHEQDSSLCELWMEGDSDLIMDAGL